MEGGLPSIVAHDDGRSTKRGRLLDRLFGRDKKVPEEYSKSDNLDDFLRQGSADTFQVAHAGPRVLAKLDTSSAPRYPNSLEVKGLGASEIRPPPRSPRRRMKKGLKVSFVDGSPETIGHGGDKCGEPTVEISKRKRYRRPVATGGAPPLRPADLQDPRSRSFGETAEAETTSTPGAMRRIQTGFPAGTEALEPARAMGQEAPSRLLDKPTTSPDKRHRSFMEMQQAQMRQDEGLAFAKAVRTASGTEEAAGDHCLAYPQAPEIYAECMTSTPPPSSATGMYPGPQSHVQHLSHQPNQIPSRPSPFSINDQNQPPSRQTSSQDLIGEMSMRPLSASSYNGKITPQPHSPTYSASLAVPESSIGLRESPCPQHGLSDSLSRLNNRYSEAESLSSHQMPGVRDGLEEAMRAFVARTRHLFELFRLHSESVRTLVSCSPDEMMRASLWWFLIGRMALENAIRDRPTSLEAEQRNGLARQQAYADLAKSYWLSEEAFPELFGNKPGTMNADIGEVRRSVASNIRKLAMSMQRNGFLPAEEAFLPQTIDRSIWLEYPQLSRDVVSLLCGSTSSSALAQGEDTSSSLGLLELLPVGDTAQHFCFGRVQADVFLMEQGRESQRLYFPCLLSILRSQKQPDIFFVIASQDGSVQLRVSEVKRTGPVWSDVRWRPENCSLEIKLPRGFLLGVRCSQQGFKTLVSMHEFSAKVHATLNPREDEQCVFRTTLRTFEYLDNDPQARIFPKEATPGCDLALFERVLREGAATGPRTYHMGYRLAVVTGPRTKTLSGVNQSYSPQMPLQFGFLRNEANDPALSLKFDKGRIKGSMILSFRDEKERMRLHSLIIGTALARDDQVCAEVPIQGVWFSERYGDTNHKSLMILSSLDWQRAKIINHDNDGDRPPCVLADRLRVVFDFKDGTVTDRVNVAPGELKLRLDTQNPSCMMVFRQPQADLTVAFADANKPREVAEGVRQALDVVVKSPTIRTYMFTSVEDLKRFETATTGFSVLYDGIASTFAISRRRMVVPIHKKWEAGQTRVQVVQQDGVSQLLVFFDDFAHGQSMSFVLKGTDVFERVSRSSKAGLKIVDAKFPLPRVNSSSSGSAQEVADAAFVCLDLPELPGEHDDICILFDSESERERLVACLPAPVKGPRTSNLKIKGLGN